MPYCYGFLRTDNALNIRALMPIYFGYLHSNLKYDNIFGVVTPNVRHFLHCRIGYCKSRKTRLMQTLFQVIKCYNIGLNIYTWVSTVYKEK